MHQSPIFSSWKQVQLSSSLLSPSYFRLCNPDEQSCSNWCSSGQSASGTPCLINVLLFFSLEVICCSLSDWKFIDSDWPKLCCKTNQKMDRRKSFQGNCNLLMIFFIQIIVHDQRRNYIPIAIVSWCFSYVDNNII